MSGEWGDLSKIECDGFTFRSMDDHEAASAQITCFGEGYR
jgi:hypothetical protein